METISLVEVSRPTGRPTANPLSGIQKASASAMNWLALSMLTGDRAKYIGLIFAISFSSFLITQQASIFATTRVQIPPGTPNQ